ncbi:ABC transporter ATP-binding protein [Verminephrobacter eiseniae]|uniref:ABC transporter ATP-binding protein n=1 Tax=Verminephrobacter eiseniae TaxID=364317 RepID=UPI0022385015|nr:ABC transporter ATP-binding protein [Verminephrobacter eiseniae]MCW5236594.1 ABC transporter ATP-binding protein [Verminephrobacter eiseniae]
MSAARPPEGAHTAAEGEGIPSIAARPPEGTPASALLEVRDLALWLRSGDMLAPLLDGISFDIAAGQMLGLVGESGCGKTVLSRTLLGLHRPGSVARVAGSIRFAGRELGTLAERDWRALRGVGIAIVFQDPMTALNPVLTVGTQIGYALTCRLGLSRARARRRTLELLEQVGIPDPARRAHQYPVQLSGGLRQRVVIALALSGNPQLLIADEPTTALDVTVQAQVLDLLDGLRRERRMAVLLISHNLAVVAAHADRVAVMYAGRIAEIGPSAALFAAPRMRYSAALLRALPRLHDDRQARLQSIDGRPPDWRALPAGCRFAPRCPQADARCAAEPPPLSGDLQTLHRFACWHPAPAGPALPQAAR